MDFKLTTLLKEVECEQSDLADIPSLKFGHLLNGQSVFDSTRYYEENQIEEIDYKVFSRVCKCFINAIINHLELDPGELFFLNKDGHILINKELTIIFLQFANPDIFIYSNQMMWDIFESGLAISDGMIASLAALRIPNNVLQDIIQQREGNEDS